MRRLLLVSLALCLLLALFAMPAAAKIGDFEEGDCPMEVPEGATEGADVICGTVIVPQSHANPDEDATFALAVAVIKSNGDDPAGDPLVRIDGGPGGSSVDSYVELMIEHPVRATRDIIIFDQRGTGYSTPALMCPEVYDVTVQYLDTVLTPDEGIQISTDATVACMQRLADEGIDLSAFNSIDNALDIPMIVAALGYDSYNVYGVSYGTTVAQTLLRNAPDGVRSVILDGVVPPQESYLNFLTDVDGAFTTFFDGCADNTDCATHYPDLEQIFFDTAAALNDDPVDITVTDPETGEDFDAVLNGDSYIGLLFNTLYVGSLIPVIPQYIYAAADGDFGFWQFVAGFFWLDQTLAYGMHYANRCSADVNYDLADVVRDGVRDDVVRVFEPGLVVYKNVCDAFDIATVPADEDVLVTTDIPTLVFEGQFDPTTPPGGGALATADFSNVYIYIFPSAGHGQLLDPCPDAMAALFLDDPTQAPDDSCFQLLTTYFVAPLTQVTMIDYSSDDLGISGIAPEGWVEVSPGIFNRYPSSSAPFMGYRVPQDGLDGYVDRIIRGGYGYDDLPDPFETLDINGVTWNLYDIVGQGLYAYFAFAEIDGQGYVMVVGAEDEDTRDFMYDNMLLPALDAFAVSN